MQDTLSFPTELPENFKRTGPEGLTEAEAARRSEAGQGNAFCEETGKSVPRIVASHLFTPFNFLNFALAACLCLVGAWRNVLFLGVVASNTLIGTVQELRARATLNRLRLMNPSEVRVRRDGAIRRVKPDALAAGDLVVLGAGEQIPADAVVLSGYGEANEAMLTGESDAVDKAPGAWLMSGSYLTAGTMEAQLVYVGEASYIHRLSRTARAIVRPKSALMTELNRLVRFIGLLLVPLGGALFAKQAFLLRAPLRDAVIGAVAAMVGMIPQGLMLLTSVALTVGVIRLGKRQTLVQELYGIETLARVDTLCLDKTGTITTGEMTLESIICEKASEGEVRTALSRFLGAFDADSPTLKALRTAIAPSDEVPESVLPFSSTIKKSAATFGGMTYVLGAPTFVLDDEAFTPRMREKVREAAERGLRVLALARCCGAIENKSVPPVSEVLAFVCLSDTLRDHADETLAYFRAQGVSVRIISGDDPATVAAIARRLKLPGADDYVDASTLTEESALRDAVRRCAVFGRVTPEQKRRLVEALKEQGHKVAMTGDGVNDIPALKAADCSIAMPGGSDAARHAAQLTLLNPDFAALPAVVAEGRRVVNNVTRSASLFLVKTLYSFALALLLLVMPMTFPFQPIQLTIISSLTIGIPSFLLALEPNAEPIRGRFLRKVLCRAVPGALAVVLCAIGCMLQTRFGWSAEVCSTMATIAAGAVGLVVLFGICRPFTPLRAGMTACLTGAMTVVFLRFGWLCYLVPLSERQRLALCAWISGGVALVVFAGWLIDRFIRE